MTVLYPCPCCGFEVFTEPAGSSDICLLCGWEDDALQLRHPARAGGANRDSLYDAQRQALRLLPLELEAVHEHRRPARWRPLRPEECLGAGRGTEDDVAGAIATAVDGRSPYDWDRA